MSSTPSIFGQPSWLVFAAAMATASRGVARAAGRSGARRGTGPALLARAAAARAVPPELERVARRAADLDPDRLRPGVRGGRVEPVLAAHAALLEAAERRHRPGA